MIDNKSLQQLPLNRKQENLKHYSKLCWIYIAPFVLCDMIILKGIFLSVRGTGHIVLQSFLPVFPLVVSTAFTSFETWFIRILCSSISSKATACWQKFSHKAWPACCKRTVLTRAWYRMVEKGEPNDAICTEYVRVRGLAMQLV